MRTSGLLVIDGRGNPIQGFSPDPDKTKELVSLDDGDKWGTTVTGWVAMMFFASGDITAYLNGVEANTLTFESSFTHCMILNTKIETVHFKNLTGEIVTLEIWGM